MTSPPIEHGHALLHDLSLKEAPEGVAPDGTFSGYASLFNVVDTDNDVMEKGCFRATLAAARKAKRAPKMLWQHDRREPIGVWTDITEDEKGLRVTGRLVLETDFGAKAYALLKAGALDGLSVGFHIVKSVRDASRNVRRITEVDLREISLVTFGAMPGALIDGVKSATNPNPSTLVAVLNRASLATSLASAAARLALTNRN
jgi:HK97 family phage prohead protease